MGGACDAALQGATSEEMMEKGKQHIHETGDEAHEELMKQMQNMSEEDMAAWQKDFEAKFEAAPEA